MIPYYLQSVEAPMPTPSFGTTNFIVLGVYLAFLVAMGAYFATRSRTANDFFLAGGRMPWWAAGVSIFGYDAFGDYLSLHTGYRL